ncbi:MAG TPA: MarR family winged helix-turn-helix transcriptional regulator [Nocardioides sp.]|uniref:MarR family winged helix-turn-helix transcriptional regulator n=1 Tax=Nocardioides sp. TaxID=35761 RepID=UPI002E320354|nr:MarR family winged helix-turn-helix transcriptional regulator [Nocardioides sp.]HEX5090828.1 MarR family winged helix-turn-helix transcriptional regulator [Nocardioides sp.]
MTDDPRVLDLDLLTYIGIVAPALNDVVVERLAQQGFEGVKVSHGYVVQRLLAGEPTITLLATQLGMTQQGASKQVLDLERLGYAERVSVVGDQRRRAVRLTDRGRRMVEATRAIRADLERKVLRRAGRERIEHAKDVLAVLFDVLDLWTPVAQRAVPPPTEP